MNSPFLKSIIICFCITSIISCHKNSDKKIPIISSNFQNSVIKKELESIVITNHLNEQINVYEFKNKLQLVNFFFVSCPTICPAMENELTPIVNANRNNDIMFLSFTINPEQDSISVLNVHAKNINANKNRLFLRTNKKSLKRIASMYLAQIKNKEDELFYHTSQAVLLDKSMRIRGLYDLLSKDEVGLLKEDIDILLRN